MGSRRGGGTPTLARGVVRRTWLGLAGIALLVGLGGGAVLGTFATADRTSTAHDQMIEATNAWDVLVNPNEGTASALDPEAVRRLPQVAELARVDGVTLVDVDSGVVDAITLVPDGVAMQTLGRPNVLSGRLPDPAAGDELLVEAAWARSAGVHVGDELHVAALHLSDLDRLKEMASQEGVDPNDPDGLRRIADEGRLGPVTTLRVVGIGVPFDGIVRNEGDDTGSLVLTPAFPDQIRSPLADLSFYYGLVVRLRSLDQLPAFRAAVDAMVPDESFAYRTLPAVRDQVQRTVRPVVVSLTTVATAGFALLLALLVVAMTRVSGATADEQRQWWVLGAVRRERLAGVGAGLGVAVLAGGAMSVVVAWLLSPLGPVGPARLAEPDRGLRFDPEIMLGGAAVLAALGLVLSLLVAWRATRISVRRAARPSRVVDRAAAAGLPGTLVVGLRNALAGPGAVLAALRALGPTFLPLGFAVRLAAGATVADLRREGPDLGPLASIEVQEVARPSDVVQLGQLSQVPFMLAAVLATLALVVAVHAVWTVVRRRRREHAVLRALGWRPRDSQASVLWHATSIMVMAIVVGLPLGLIAGRWVWGRLARFLGTVSVSVAPLGTLLAVAGAFGLIAVAGAFVPAQRAGHRPPAADLRTE